MEWRKMTTPPVLSEEDRAFRRRLTESNYVVSLSMSPGWKVVADYIQMLCDEAAVTLMSNTDSRDDTALRIRAQQRLLMRDDIHGFINNARESVTAQRNGEADGDAASYA